MMLCYIPQFRLTHGQLLWTLCQGAAPVGPRRRLLLDQLRYLRQLKIPFNEQRRGKGRGRPIHYSFEEMMEIAIGLFALRRGVRPHLVADLLVTNRTALRRSFRRALEDQPATALEASWVKSRGKEIPLLADEQFLRLHNRMLEAPGTYELVKPGEAQALLDVFGQRELFPDGTAEILIPLTRLVLELIYWARQAPEIRPGRKTKGQESPTPSSVVRV
jgi:hypothetical protein